MNGMPKSWNQYQSVYISIAIQMMYMLINCWLAPHYPRPHLVIPRTASLLGLAAILLLACLLNIPSFAEYTTEVCTGNISQVWLDHTGPTKYVLGLKGAQSVRWCKPLLAIVVCKIGWASHRNYSKYPILTMMTKMIIICLGWGTPVFSQKAINMKCSTKTLIWCCSLFVSMKLAYNAMHDCIFVIYIALFETMCHSIIIH